MAEEATPPFDLALFATDIRWYEIGRTKASTEAFQQRLGVNVTAHYTHLVRLGDGKSQFNIENSELNVESGTLNTTTAVATQRDGLVFDVAFANVPVRGTYEVYFWKASVVPGEPYQWVVVGNGLHTLDDPAAQFWVLTPSTNLRQHGAFFEAARQAIATGFHIDFSKVLALIQPTPQGVIGIKSGMLITGKLATKLAVKPMVLNAGPARRIPAEK